MTQLIQTPPQINRQHNVGLLPSLARINLISKKAETKRVLNLSSVGTQAARTSSLMIWMREHGQPLRSTAKKNSHKSLLSLKYQSSAILSWGALKRVLESSKLKNWGGSGSSHDISMMMTMSFAFVLKVTLWSTASLAASNCKFTPVKRRSRWIRKCAARCAVSRCWWSMMSRSIWFRWRDCLRPRTSNSLRASRAGKLSGSSLWSWRRSVANPPTRSCWPIFRCLRLMAFRFASRLISSRSITRNLQKPTLKSCTNLSRQSRARWSR